MNKGSKYLYMSLIFASFGGMVVGYQTGVISGVLVFLKGGYALLAYGKEFLVTSILLGALVASLIAGFISDFLGRKITLCLFGFLGCVSSYYLMISPSLVTMFISRTILGFTIGAYTTIIPVYISETALKENRGAFIALFQFWVTIGILLAFLVNYLLAESMCWHASFSVGFLLSIIHLLMLFCIPKSSMWLYSKNKEEKALKIMKRLYAIEVLEERLALAEESKASSKKGFLDLFKPGLFSAIFAAVSVAIFQQLTGINTVMYYGPIIFNQVGFTTTKGALLAAVIMGTVNVISTIFSFYLVDSVGRKPLLLAGTLWMGVSLVALALGSQFGYFSIFAVLVYVFFFAISIGPVTFIIISELFPTELRAEASGLAIFANSFMNILVTLSFLTLLEYIGTLGVFMSFGLICLFAHGFIRVYIPETKKKSLEEIQEFWKK